MVGGANTCDGPDLWGIHRNPAMTANLQPCERSGKDPKNEKKLVGWLHMEGGSPSGRMVGWSHGEWLPRGKTPWGLLGGSPRCFTDNGFLE